ncbi:hypothetical protein E3N88_28987 [Mikania micrantha]|uniref:Phosphatidylinositol N-acetylglucosaminyltransferase subunit H conserved domain-containing protein n=1 Tax=Mikania micrantha TaxID=192012 RepID=A0A5N6N226_9ASTR|nr:hypothetical protein E3N88_28987 [Mikania micrantha]
MLALIRRSPSQEATNNHRLPLPLAAITMYELVLVDQDDGGDCAIHWEKLSSCGNQFLCPDDASVSRPRSDLNVVVDPSGKTVTTVIWSLFMFAILIKLLIQRPIVKESVIIMPEFGVQLETHYGSGKINRRFIPVSKILKPVLNEHVTPVTCCWCLSLLIRNENELTLVFKKFRPPLKMLVPIWKALCVATDCEESVEFQEDG